VIICPKLIDLLAQILALNLVVTRALIGRDIELKMSLGLPCNSMWLGQSHPSEKPRERIWITEATDPCTVASAPIGKLGEVFTGASWTGVSVSAHAEADWLDTM